MSLLRSSSLLLLTEADIGSYECPVPYSIMGSWEWVNQPTALAKTTVRRLPAQRACGGRGSTTARGQAPNPPHPFPTVPWPCTTYMHIRGAGTCPILLPADPDCCTRNPPRPPLLCQNLLRPEDSVPALQRLPVGFSAPLSALLAGIRSCVWLEVNAWGLEQRQGIRATRGMRSIQFPPAPTSPRTARRGSGGQYC